MGPAALSATLPKVADSRDNRLMPPTVFPPNVTATPHSKVVFVDVDGTLLDHSQVLDQTTLLAIRAARERGHLVFLATGRALQNVPQQVMDIGFDGAITNGGGSVWVGDQELFERTLTEQEADRLFTYFDQEGINYMVQTTGTSYISEGFVDSVRDLELALAAQGTKEEDLAILKWVSSFPPVSGLDRRTATKAVFNSPDPETVTKAREALGDLFHVVDGSIRTSLGTTGELGPKGITKGAAIELVLDHLGVDPERAIGIGDSFNDVEMFDVVGTAVAMDNAEPELKERADLVTTGVDNHGVQNALRTLNLI